MKFGKYPLQIPEENKLVDGFIYFYVSSLYSLKLGGNDPSWLIFFRWPTQPPTRKSILFKLEVLGWLLQISGWFSRELYFCWRNSEDWSQGPRPIMTMGLATQNWCENSEACMMPTFLRTSQGFLKQSCFFVVDIIWLLHRFTSHSYVPRAYCTCEPNAEKKLISETKAESWRE